MFWFSTFLLLMVSIIAFVLLNKCIFRRTDQESSPQAKIFPWSRRYSTSKGFSMINECSMIKEIHHKQWLFHDQENFLQARNFSMMKEMFHNQRLIRDQQSFSQAEIFPQPKKFSTNKIFSTITEVFHKRRFYITS